MLNDRITDFFVTNLKSTPELRNILFNPNSQPEYIWSKDNGIDFDIRSHRYYKVRLLNECNWDSDRYYVIYDESNIVTLTEDFGVNPKISFLRLSQLVDSFIDILHKEEINVILIANSQISNIFQTFKETFSQKSITLIKVFMPNKTIYF